MSMETYSGRAGKKCAIYIRVSSERQVQGFSLDGQRRYLSEWAQMEGMAVLQVYVEPGKSGKSITGREVFQKMLSDISTGVINVDYIVVFKLSRFGRNAKDILNSLTHIQRYGVNLICKEDGLDSSTAMGRMMITILGAVAEVERENIIIQSALGREEKARQGGWNGGVAPYGYRLVNGKFEVQEDEAQMVRKVFDMFVNQGMGYSTIAAYLNKQGILKLPTAHPRHRPFTDWSAYHIKRILDNVAYIGRVAFGKTRTERIPGTENEYRRVKSKDYIVSEGVVHTPIISDELFEKARLKRQEDGAKGNPRIGRTAKHLLSGILKCPQCGMAMYSDMAQWKHKDGTVKERLFYQCGHYSKSRNG